MCNSPDPELNNHVVQNKSPAAAELFIPNHIVILSEAKDLCISPTPSHTQIQPRRLCNPFHLPKVRNPNLFVLHKC